MGAGKSTLLALIKQHLSHVNVVTEPVDCWHHSTHGKSLLGQFYEDQNRWSYTMEKFTLITRVREYLKEQHKNSSPTIMERSIYSGYYCFAKNGYLQGNMTKAEWKAYNLWFEFLVKDTCKKPRGFIYLYTTPEVCFKRMHKRKRVGEEEVPLKYLQELHTAHEQFLIEKKEILSDLISIPVLKLNVCKDFADNSIAIKSLMDEISSFLLMHSQNPQTARNYLSSTTP